MAKRIMVGLFLFIVQQITIIAADTERNNSGNVTRVSLANTSVCGISWGTKQNQLLLMSDIALAQMASVNETLRKLLSDRRKLSGLTICETHVCTSYDTEKMQCNYQAFSLIQQAELTPTVVVSSFKRRLKICGIGTGDSGCGSLRDRTSPCGTISYESSGLSQTRSCEWTINVHDSKQVLLTFNYIYIRYCGNQCLCDSITVYDNSKASEEKHIFCGYRKDLELITRSSIVRITFDSNNSITGMGFRLHYQGIQGTELRSSSPIKLTGQNGTFRIPPASPGRVNQESLIFEWYIRTDESKMINLSWYLENTCPQGYHMKVAAYEGKFEAGLILREVNVSNVHRETILSKGFQLSVRLIQPRSCKLQYYEAYFVAFLVNSMRNGYKTSVEDIFFESKEQLHSVHLTTRNVPSPMFRLYRYKVRIGLYLKINIRGYQFHGPNIDNCAYEGFILWTGDKSQDKYGPFCGTHVATNFFTAKDKIKKSSPVIHSSANSLNVFFYSYGLTYETKLNFTVSMSKCIGIFDLDSRNNLKTELFDFTRTDNSIILAPLRETCFHIQELPSEMPCNKKTSFTLAEDGAKYFPRAKYRLAQYNPVRGCILDYEYRVYEYDYIDSYKIFYQVDCKCPIRAGGYLLGISTVTEEFQTFDPNWKMRNHLFIFSAKHGLVHVNLNNIWIKLRAPLHLYENHHFELSFRLKEYVHQANPFPVKVAERPYHEKKLYIDTFQVYDSIMPCQYSSAWSYILETMLYLHLRPSYYVLEYKLKPDQEPLPDPDSYICPSGTVRFQQACYRYHRIGENVNTTWNDAKKICERQGSKLLCINEESELSFIKGMLKRQWITQDSSNMIKRMIYIGLKPVDKVYRWLDGSVATFTEWYKPLPGKIQMATDSLFGKATGFASPLLMQPSNNLSSTCTGMVVVTPSLPTQWLRIPCHFPYPDSSFICEYRINKVENRSKQNEINTVGDDMMTILHKEGNLTRIVPSTKRCPVGYTARKGSCFILLSSTGLINMSISCSAAKVMCAREMGEIAINVTSVPLELLNIWLHRPEYGNVWVGDCDLLIYNETESQWKLEAAQPNTTSSRVLNVLCETSALKVNSVCGLGQFECNDRTCISDTRRCDGKHHCPEGDDEASCECGDSYFRCENRQCIPFAKYCDFVQDCEDNSDEKNCTYDFCPPNYGQCDNGQCIHIYKIGDYKVDCMDASDKNKKYTEYSECDKFRCLSGECLPTCMVTNMRPDCTGPKQEDEVLLQDEVKRGVWSTITDLHVNMTPYCPMGNGNLTRCRFDHVLCFPRHLACIYDEDEYGYMSSCPDGDHLRHCRAFECPNMFKCPESYCVPYHKICDGKTDCPEAHDENNCTNISCPGLFKCSAEGICLDQSLVCDGIVHCKKSFDDEAACPYTKCPSGCLCEGRSVTCTNVTNNTMLAMPFDIRLLYLLTTENQSLGDLEAHWFKDLLHLGQLHLKDLGIRSIRQRAFGNLHNLLTLDLRNNLLKLIQKGTFVGLNNLQHLQLSGNPIHTLGEDAFQGLISIRYLHLDNLNISSVADECFRSLRGIAILSLMNNSISIVSPHTWTGLNSLRILNLKGNAIHQVPSKIFHNLTLEELHTDHFRLCCFAKHVKNCTPEGDAFSSCDDLVGNSILQVLIWVLGVAAVLGNLAVIIARLITQGKQVCSILIVNLSVSDFLMGVYLLIIASADVTYRGKYIFFADDWRSSWLCKFAGFLSTLSSEMSVFMLLVIAADRLVSIVFTFKTRKLSFKKAIFTMITGWTVFSILSAIPVIEFPYFGKNYIKNGVCMLFNIPGGKSQGWEYSTFIFLLFNVIGFFFLFIVYMYIYCSVNKRRLKANRDATDKEFELAQKFVLIVATDFICWVPLVCTAFLSLSGIPINPTASVWMAVIVLPINSALNPFLYTFSALRQIKKNLKPQRYRHN